mgnify:CR=1 FL=1
MEGQKFFNKKQLNFQFKLINFFKNRFFGIKKHTIQKFEERLEVTDNNKPRKFSGFFYTKFF